MTVFSCIIVGRIVGNTEVSICARNRMCLYRCDQYRDCAGLPFVPRCFASSVGPIWVQFGANKNCEGLYFALFGLFRASKSLKLRD
jgi:hypothetical protein